MPSRLEAIYDDYSYQDIKMKVRLRSEEKMAGTRQDYETLCLVASAALGGKPERTSTAIPQTADDIEAVLTRALG